MFPFTLEQPSDIPAAIQLGEAPAAEYIAGGTDMVQLLVDDIRRPERLIALGGIVDNRIETAPDGSLRLGAGARMSDVADDPAVRASFPLIAETLLASASPQVRNMATVGGNLLQRTRCPYFRDPGFRRCNKRSPGTGCEAMEGVNRTHAVLGGSDHCIATHASDVAVALVALNASVHLRRRSSERVVRLEDFHRLPESTPHLETVLEPGELIVAIEVPPAGSFAQHSHYLKVRDRASFEFALVSAAVALNTEGDRIRSARIAMGGVGTKPWRMHAVEEALAGSALDSSAFRMASERSAGGAVSRGGNAFKLELMKRTLTRALEIAAGTA